MVIQKYVIETSVSNKLVKTFSTIWLSKDAFFSPISLSQVHDLFSRDIGRGIFIKITG